MLAPKYHIFEPLSSSTFSTIQVVMWNSLLEKSLMLNLFWTRPDILHNILYVLSDSYASSVNRPRRSVANPFSFRTLATYLLRGLFRPLPELRENMISAFRLVNGWIYQLLTPNVTKLSNGISISVIFAWRLYNA